MTSPSAKTHNEYIASLPDGPRTVAKKMRAVIRASAPGATEAIKYGIPSFLCSGSPFIYFAVWKKHVGIYPIYNASPDLERRIAPYRHGKDTIRFSLAEPIDYELVTLLVRFKLELALGKETAPKRKERKRNKPLFASRGRRNVVARGPMRGDDSP